MEGFGLRGDTGQNVIEGTLGEILAAPGRSAYVDHQRDALAVYDCGEGTTPEDNAWLDGVLESHGVTHLPASEYITEGPLAGWRCWTIRLRPGS
jgi:hypothetical protein